MFNHENLDNVWMLIKFVKLMVLSENEYIKAFVSDLLTGPKPIKYLISFGVLYEK